MKGLIELVLSTMRATLYSFGNISNKGDIRDVISTSGALESAVEWEPLSWSDGRKIEHVLM